MGKEKHSKTKSNRLSDNPKWSFNYRDDNRNYQRVKLANLNFLNDVKIGFTLNICCGLDPTGDVKADIDEELLRRVKNSRIDSCDYVICDVMNPPFRNNSFDTVICDPPFKFYNRLSWIVRLADLARKRLILSSTPIDIKLTKKIWHRQLYCIRGVGIFLRLWWVFTRRNGQSREGINSADEG